MTTLLQIQSRQDAPPETRSPETWPLETWHSASWDTFVQVADDEASAKLKSYYYDGRMRFEPMSTGSDHSKNHMTLTLSIGIFTMLTQIPVNGHDACSYRKTGFDEFQPDLSYYVGESADAIPWGTRVVNLDEYPLPSLVIEVSDTSLLDDLGMKRLQYEDLGIPEYWIVNVKAMQILAFSTAADGSTRRIQASLVLPGLRLEVLEQALQRSRQENQSKTTAWLMQQFQKSNPAE